LTAALSGAWTWIAGDMRSLGRVRDLALEEAAVQQAVAALEQIDLAMQPEGSMGWRDYRVAWYAEPLEPPRAGRTSVGGPSVYEFTLYSVSLEVHHRERLIATPALRMLRHARSTTVQELP